MVVVAKYEAVRLMKDSQMKMIVAGCEAMQSAGGAMDV